MAARCEASRAPPSMTMLAVAGATALGVSAAFSSMAFSTPVQPQPLAHRAPSRFRGSRLASTLDATTGSSSASTSSATAIFGASALIAFAASQLQKRQPRRSHVRRNATATMQAPPTTSAKKDLTGALPDCPSTIWNADNIDLDNLPDVEETAPLVIDALDYVEQLTNGGEEAFFTEQREKFMAQLQKHGAILFRNFDMMMDTDGFRRFYESLQLNPCLDPIHTSGLRDMIGKKNAVYEAVNKPSLAKHLVGLHNESTFVKTATFGAFVCFKPATEGGGEFFIADGAKIIKDMDPGVLRRIYDKKVRIAVSNLDMNFVDVLPSPLKEGTKSALQDLVMKTVAPKFDMDLEMIYGADTTNPNRLQAIEHPQSPINTHPVTGQPVWFCNLHNHSRYLRDRRECSVPEVGMTDVFYGDLSRIPPADVEHINEVCEKNIVPMMMKRGDVMLLDNYRVLHGRKTFKGERKHAVTWFEPCGETLQRDVLKEKPDDFMNMLINKTLL